MSAKKWAISFLSLSVVILVIMMGVIYLYDPFCYYRMPENRLITNNYRFVNAGITKNADYDTVIIGSSMTQNFNMDSFREKLGMNPVKLTVGGMSVEGMELTCNLVKDVGKAKNLFVCIDLPSLNKDKDSLASYATYLYNTSPMDDYKYLLGYETWARLFPLNVAFDSASKLGIELPSAYGCHNIDDIGAWHSTAKYGKDLVIKEYQKDSSGISKQKVEGAYNRMTKNIDKIIEILCADEDTNVVLFLPPYSVLYWAELMRLDLFDVNMRAKEYMLEALKDKPNVKVYDFQSMPIISNLDNYKDITHYSADINEEMVNCFKYGKYIVTAENIFDSNEALRVMVESFKQENSDWIKQ